MEKNDANSWICWHDCHKGESPYALQTAGEKPNVYAEEASQYHSIIYNRTGITLWVGWGWGGNPLTKQDVDKKHSLWCLRQTHLLVLTFYFATWTSHYFLNWHWALAYLLTTTGFSSNFVLQFSPVELRQIQKLVIGHILLPLCYAVMILEENIFWGSYSSHILTKLNSALYYFWPPLPNPSLIKRICSIQNDMLVNGR